MGHGIAQVAAAAGCQVTLSDVSQEAVDRGLARIRANLDKGIDRGKVTPAERDQTLKRLTGSVPAGDALGGADLVVEAVPELPDLKRQVLTRAGREAPPTAIIATNTSSLPVTSLASAVPEAGRVLGLHFFNPPHLMRLVEIIVGRETRDEIVQVARVWVERLGKVGIVVKDSPGFATSRLGLVIGLEAMRMVESGVASAEDIDRAMELGYNHPMGPLMLSDLVGLDVRLGISEALARELDPVRFRPPEILRRMVAEGRLGKKSGEGFYRWTEKGPVPLP
jgi:3-hydroxybutyryl-CoA dehydrogenase